MFVLVRDEVILLDQLQVIISTTKLSFIDVFLLLIPLLIQIVLALLYDSMISQIFSLIFIILILIERSLLCLGFGLSGFQFLDRRLRCGRCNDIDRNGAHITVDKRHAAFLISLT